GERQRGGGGGGAGGGGGGGGGGRDGRGGQEGARPPLSASSGGRPPPRQPRPRLARLARYFFSSTAWIMTMRFSARFRCCAWTISASRSPMMMRCALYGGMSAALLGPAMSIVTSSHARATKPAASIATRIASGARRKLDALSRAHITGNTTGCTEPAIGS